MELGALSISLAIKDMAASRDFYSKLRFAMIAGDGETWTIVANQGHVVGLFQGMFDSNILTFNPGWAGLGEPVEEFTDIRVLSNQLREQGIELASDTTEETPSAPRASRSLIPTATRSSSTSTYRGSGQGAR